MTLNRKSKPEWFLLIDRINAIREMGIATGIELANHLSQRHQRVYEWINSHREAKAERTIEIQQWVKDQEWKIAKAKKWAEYQKILKRLKKG